MRHFFLEVKMVYYCFKRPFSKRLCLAMRHFFLEVKKDIVLSYGFFSENSCGCIVFFLFVPFAFTFVALGEKFELDIAQNSRPRQKKWNTKPKVWNQVFLKLISHKYFRWKHDIVIAQQVLEICRNTTLAQGSIVLISHVLDQPVRGWNDFWFVHHAVVRVL